MPKNNLQQSLNIVGDYLIRFYHEEPNDTKASTAAIQALTGRIKEEWSVACAFATVLESPLPENCIRDIVRDKANRYALHDADAKAFLNRVYNDNTLDCALEPDEDEET